MNDLNKKLALKWYDALKFPEELRDEFIDVLENCSLIDADLSKTTEEIHNMKDLQANLVYSLCKCEETLKEYNQKGIPQKILIDTMSDITVWTMNYYEREHKFGFEIIQWMNLHFSLKMYKLGNLQFAMAPSIADNEELGLKVGDNTIDMHIQRYVSLDMKDIKESFDMAKDFFAMYFPEYDYQHFTCHSWLLNPLLEDFLNEDSKIIQFQRLFKIIHKSEGDNILVFVFRKGITRENIEEFEPKTTLQKKAKEYALTGKPFYNGYGVIRKDDTP